jgi:DNA-binding winged helix-turn-helix (wHTH) protein/pimeloyl-ACP methyl ester carboxylesterase
MIVCFGPCELDFDRRELRSGERTVHVEPQVFDLLAHLIAKRDRVVSRDEIIEAVWRGRIVSDATLSSRINAARQAVGDSGKAQTVIRTIPRRGFRFVGDIRDKGAPDRIPSGVPKNGGSSLEPKAPPKQTVTFCTAADGVRLAVGVVGAGDVLVKTANWLNHVEYDWQSPVWAPTFCRWAEKHKLIRYDQRGTGLSDWDVSDICFDAFVRDLETVIDSLGLERFALFGISQGAAVSIAYAAKFPHRVSKLVLHGAYALGRTKRNTTEDEEQAAAYLTLIRHGWGYPHSAFMQAFSSLYLPDGTSEQIKWFSELQRVTTSPENAIRIRKACDEIDIVDLLAKVRAPTLVTHSRNDNVVPFDHGRKIASAISGARFLGLQSSNHAILPGELAWPTFMTEIEQFLSAPA